MDYLGVYLVVTLCVSFLLVKVLIVQFQQTLIDLPNERSSHTLPTPRGGGLGFIISFFVILGISSVMGQPTHQTASPFIWFSLVPLVIIGFLDDWKTLPASIRYLVQLSVSATVVIILGAFPLFPDVLATNIILTTIAIVLTTIGMTALINFYNFMDGLDGLVAGTSVVQIGFLALWSENSTLWILVAAILGFLWWNWQPAKIFMGDSGSTLLGAAIAIALLSKDTSPADAWAALTITLPITVDTIYTLVLRLAKGENVFEAHRSHLFQRLHQSGWSHAKVSIFYILASIVVSITLFALGPLGGGINLIGAGICLIGVEFYLKRTTVKYSS